MNLVKLKFIDILENLLKDYFLQEITFSPKMKNDNLSHEMYHYRLTR